MQYEEKTHFAKNCALRGAYRRGLSVCGTHAEGGKTGGTASTAGRTQRSVWQLYKKTDSKRSTKTEWSSEKTEDAPYRPVLEYMNAYEVKLEQEIIRYSAAFR